MCVSVCACLQTNLTNCVSMSVCMCVCTYDTLKVISPAHQPNAAKTIHERIYI